MNDEVASGKPTMLKVGGVVSTVAGAIFVIGGVLAGFGFADTSTLGNSDLGTWAIPVWVASLLLFGSYLLVIGYGIRRERSWARPAAVCFWVSLGMTHLLGLIVGVRSETTDLTWALFLLISLWYFYGKRNVRHYFKSLRPPRAA